MCLFSAITACRVLIITVRVNYFSTPLTFHSVELENSSKPAQPEQKCCLHVKPEVEQSERNYNSLYICLFWADVAPP